MAETMMTIDQMHYAGWQDCLRLSNGRIKLIVTGLHMQPLNEMVKSNLYDLIGEDNVFSNMKDALSRAEELLREKK